MKKNYNIILKKINDRYYLFIPELSLIAESKNLSIAYKNLEKEKRKYFTQVLELNAQETIREPLPIVIRKKLFVDLLTFFLKAVIIFMMITFAFLVSFPFLSQIPNLAVNSIIQFSNNTNQRLKSMSPEEREKELIELRETVQNIKPFTDELKVIWENENCN